MGAAAQPALPTYSQPAGSPAPDPMLALGARPLGASQGSPLTPDPMVALGARPLGAATAPARGAPGAMPSDPQKAAQWLAAHEGAAPITQSPGAPPISAASIREALTPAAVARAAAQTPLGSPLAGVAEGAAHTLYDAEEAVNHIPVLGPLAQRADQAFDRATGEPSLPAQAPAWTAPTNIGQRMGRGAEQFAEYVLPETRAIEGADALNAATKAPAVLRAATRVGATAAANAGMGALQGQSALSTGLQAAALGLGFEGLRVPKSLSEFLHGKLVGGVAPGAEEVVAHAKSEGVPVTAAQASDAHPLKLLQKTGEGSLLGAGLVTRRLEAIREAMGAAYGRFLDRLAPKDAMQLALGRAGPAMDRAASGAHIAQSLEEHGINAGRRAADAEFGELGREIGGATMSRAGIRHVARDIVAKWGPYFEMHPQAMTGARTAWAWVRDLATARGVREAPIGFDELQRVRSDLLALGRQNPDPLKDVTSGWYKRLAAAADADMEGMAKSAGPEVLARFRGANAHWRALQEDFNDPRSLLRQALDVPDKRGVVPMLMGPGGGGSLHYLRLLRAYTAPEDAPVIRRAFLDMLGDNGSGVFDPAAFRRNLGKYSDAYLQSLLGDETSALARGAAKRSLAESLLDRYGSATPNWRTFPEQVHHLSGAGAETAGLSGDEVGWLRRHAALAKAVGEDINPSGTGPARQAAAQASAAATGLGGAAAALATGHPEVAAGAALGGAAPAAASYGAARLSLSEFLKRWAMEGPRPRRGLAQFLLEREAAAQAALARSQAQQ